MGQQQLLLLVLGIVIVGLAVVVGIQAFSDNLVKSEADALTVDVARVASDLQAWAQKPVAFGGGGSSFQPNSVDVDFDNLGYPTGDQSLTTCTPGGTDYETPNGSISLAITGATAATITAIGCATDGTTRNTVVATVSGLGAGDISTVVN